MGIKVEIAEPSAHLKSFIRYYKNVESDFTGILKVIPIMHEELYFHFTHINVFSKGYYDIDNANVVLVGLQQYYQDGYTHMYGTGRGGGFSIVFQPQGFYRLFNIRSSDFSSYAIRGESILKQEFNLLHEQLQRFFNVNDMKEHIERFLTKYARHAEASPDIVQKIINYIEENNGMLTISQLCNVFNLTPRTIQRKFKNDVGIPIIELCHISRINKAIKLLNQDSASNLSRISYLSGYYDQAHFTHDIKKITGITPGQIKSNYDKEETTYHNRLFIRAD